MTHMRPPRQIIKDKSGSLCLKILLVSSLIFIIVGWSLKIFLAASHQPPLEVIFFNVGQGDAALIKTPSRQTILIDGGPDNSVLRGLGKNLSFFRRRIDTIIVSHYHDDHITGLIEIINRYKVGKIIFPAESPTSEISTIFLSAAQDKKIPIIFLSASATLEFAAGCQLFLLNPDVFDIKPDDNDSLIARLDCHQKRFLFTGDSNSKVERALINSGLDWRADVLKASHHGSITANSEAFLRAVAPRLLIIPVGADNRFGHPSPVILDRAVSLGILVRRTDQDGEIRFKE
ncbi:MAG: MBL fold metallo-hydrolase [Patescibacteria group bacterium]